MGIKAKNLNEYLQGKSKHLDDGCIQWTGSIGKEGYGNTSCLSWARIHKVSLAHQLAYINAHGDYNRDYGVYRTCKLRSCINPEHLYLRLKVAYW